MTREDVIGKINDEFEKNSITYEEVTEHTYSVTVGNKQVMLTFYELSVGITAYWNTRNNSHRLASMDFFYDDITMVWVSEKRLFVQSGRSYNVFYLGRD